MPTKKKRTKVKKPAPLPDVTQKVVKKTERRTGGGGGKIVNHVEERTNKAAHG